MNKVEIKHVSKKFHQAQVLSDISLEINESEMLVLVGPSGCGKSTLLRSIAGFESLTDGEIWINGERVNDLPPQQRGVAMVFQNYALYPHMTVAENIGFGLKNLRTPKNEIQKQVRQVAETLQIEPLLSRKPTELSGGQRQRVAIGRAIIKNPKVFLFDEPLSNLDASLRSQMRIEIAKLHQLFRSPMIYVTHDQVEAMTLADRIAVLNAGRIEQVGPPLELYHEPKNQFVASFFGSPSMNFIGGVLIESSVTSARIRLFNNSVLQLRVNAMSLLPGAKVIIGVRPEKVKVHDSLGQIKGTVSLVERLGNRMLIYLNLNTHGPFIIESQIDSIHLDRLKVSDSISVQLSEENIYLFDENGISLPRVIPISARSA
jgi:multiple sugar transport system ATP-binding protein